MINTNEFEQRLKDMSAEDLDALMRRMGEPFDSFANALAKGSIKELAPPFGDYQSFQGGLLEYYEEFFLRYRQYLDDHYCPIKKGNSIFETVEL